MSRALLGPYAFQRDIRRLRALPKDSEKRASLIEKLSKAVWISLEEGCTGELRNLLDERYICPFNFQPTHEKNIEKLTKLIVTAFVDPLVVHQMKFLVTINEETQNSLRIMCEKNFNPYLVVVVMRPRSSLWISFKAV